MNDAQDNAATTKPKATGAPLRMVPSKSKRLVPLRLLVGRSPEEVHAIDREEHWDTRSGHKIPPRFLVGRSPEEVHAIDREEHWDTRSGPKIPPRPFGQPEEEEPLRVSPKAKSAPKRKKKPDAKSVAAKKKPKQVTYYKPPRAAAAARDQK